MLSRYRGPWNGHVLCTGPPHRRSFIVLSCARYAELRMQPVHHLFIRPRSGVLATYCARAFTRKDPLQSVDKSPEQTLNPEPAPHRVFQNVRLSGTIKPPWQPRSPVWAVVLSVSP